MFKKLGMIGLAGAITLSVASEAMADLKFWGGDMWSQTVIRPFQNLQITPTPLGDIISRTQGLIGDTITLGTTRMSGMVSDNQFLRRTTQAEVGKIILSRQVTAGGGGPGNRTASIQEISLSVVGRTSDHLDLRGNRGTIMFDSASGTDLSIIFNNLSQQASDSPTGSMTAQTDDVRAVMRSPGTSADNPMSLVATGDATGKRESKGSIILKVTKTQQHKGFRGDEYFNTTTTSVSYIILDSETQMGTIEIQ